MATTSAASTAPTYLTVSMVQKCCQNTEQWVLCRQPKPRCWQGCAPFWNSSGCLQNSGPWVVGLSFPFSPWLLAWGCCHLLEAACIPRLRFIFSSILHASKGGRILLTLESLTSLCRVSSLLLFSAASKSSVAFKGWCDSIGSRTIFLFKVSWSEFLIPSTKSLLAILRSVSD